MWWLLTSCCDGVQLYQFEVYDITQRLNLFVHDYQLNLKLGWHRISKSFCCNCGFFIYTYGRWHTTMGCYIWSRATTTIVMMRCGIAIVTIGRWITRGIWWWSIVIICAICWLHICIGMWRSRCLLAIMMMLGSRGVIETIGRAWWTGFLENKKYKCYS